MSTLKVGDIKHESFTGTTQLKLDSAGRLLLGTTTEGQASADDLTIATTGNTGITVRSGTSNAGNIYFSDATSGTAEYAGYVSYSHSTNSLSFGTNDGSERMRILSGGEVAIGGSGYSGQPFSVQTSGSSVGYLQSTGTTRATLGFVDANSNVNVGFGAIGNNHVFLKDASEKMRIDSSGKVGINTTSPVGKLTVDENNASEHFQLRNTTNTSNFSAFGVDSSFNLRIYTNGSNERMRIDSSGKVGIGLTNPTQKLHISGASGQDTYFQTDTLVNGGLLINVQGTQRGVFANDSAFSGTQTDIGIGAKGNMIFRTGTSGYTERMRITSAGYVYLGNGFSTTNHRINGDGKTQGQTFLVVSAYNSSSQDTAIFFGVDVLGGNTASCGIKVGKNSTNSRSINAGGTINASGSDYAEYMTKSGDFTLAKGDICGINAEGKLTDKFSESISFVVKSTDPSYVGGDSWGGEDILGEKPKDDSPDLPAYELKMEAARKLVDRIAFSGQVPVNITGATAGQHIIPTEGSGDTITGVAKTEASLSMAEYMSSIGKVITLESDGRARIIVKVS